MKKMFYALALLLVVALAFAACSGNDDNDVPESGQAGQETNQNDSGEADAPGEDNDGGETATVEPPPPPRDLGGYRYVIANFYAPYVWDPVYGYSHMRDQMYWHFRDLEETLNIEIYPIFIPPAEFHDRANTAAAAGTKFADQVHMNMGTLSSFRQAGFLVAFDDLDIINPYDPKWNQFYLDIARDPATGRLYGIDWLSWPNRRTFPDMGLFFNRTLIAQLGVPCPYELFDAGEWTWDNFRQILLDVTDHEAGRYGISVVYDLLERAAVVSNGVEFLENNNGRLEFNMNNEATYRALEFTSQIRNVDRTFMSFPPDAHWYSPLQALRDHDVVFAMRDIIFWNDIRDNEHEFGMVPFPMGPDLGNAAWPGATWNNDVQTQGIFSIGNNVEYAAYILNRLAEPFESYGINEWQDVTRRDHFMNDARAFEIYLQMNANAITDGAGVFNGHVFGLLRDAFFDSSINQTRTPAEAFEGIAGEIQMFLDDNFNN